MRVLGGVGLLVAVAAVAWMLGSDAREPAAARAPQADPRIHDLQQRVLALEEHLRRLQARPVAAEAAPETPAPEPAVEPAPARVVATRDQKEKMRQQWTQRVLEATTPAKQRAALRDGHSQLKAHADREAIEGFLRDVIDRVGPASDLGLEATLQLGHLAREEKDWVRADEHYRRVEGLAGSGSDRQAEAIFQLAWTRSFAGEPEAAAREFERALTVPGIRPGTSAAARWALAHRKREAGDLPGAEQELRRILDLAADHPADGFVKYYVDLAKKQLPQ